MHNIIVTIPTYNSSLNILETLISLANQTLIPDRVLIIDNHSDDNTVEICDSRRWPFDLNVIKHSLHVPLASSLNRCLEYASESNFLIIPHSDDVYHYEFVEQSIKSLIQEPSTSITTSRARVLSEHISILSLLRHLKWSTDITLPLSISLFPPKLHLSYTSRLFRALHFFNPLIACTITLNCKNFLSNSKPIKFNPTKTYTVDWDFYLRCIRAGHKFAKPIKKPLVQSRVSKTQVSSSLSLTARYFAERHDTIFQNRPPSVLDLGWFSFSLLTYVLAIIDNSFEFIFKVR